MGPLYSVVGRMVRQSEKPTKACCNQVAYCVPSAVLSKNGQTPSPPWLLVFPAIGLLTVMFYHRIIQEALFSPSVGLSIVREEAVMNP